MSPSYMGTLINRDTYWFSVSVLHPDVHAFHICGSLTSFILFTNSAYQGLLKHVKISVQVSDAHFHPFHFLCGSVNNWVETHEYSLQFAFCRKHPSGERLIGK